MTSFYSAGTYTAVVIMPWKSLVQTTEENLISNTPHSYVIPRACCDWACKNRAKPHIKFGLVFKFQITISFKVFLIGDFHKFIRKQTKFTELILLQVKSVS